MIGMCVMAAATEWLGLHPVFGAFLFGACLPRDDRLLETLIERVEYVAVIVLMPVFFALAGLNTTPDAFTGTGLAALLLILGAAIVGKILGSGGGARIRCRSRRTRSANRRSKSARIISPTCSAFARISTPSRSASSASASSSAKGAAISRT
jgi:Kef-type K+ transport system membrane component KefB